MSLLRIASCFWMISLLLVLSCNSDSLAGVSSQVYRFRGETMGTYYQVSYLGEEYANLQQSIDSLLVSFNLEVSTYIDSSVISRFNQGEEWEAILSEVSTIDHFIANVALADSVYQMSQGYFDPTVMPLVNYWGFGYTPKRKVTTVDSSRVDSLLQFVGWYKLTGDSAINLVDKPFGVELDFSALAKGYGVDLVGQFLQDRGIHNYLIDIGGEVGARGDKGAAGPWQVGIATPREDADLDDYQVAVPVQNCGMATSGNYRNFYEVDGRKYSHTINPLTGFPERSRLLSASVIAPNCALADALATACMVAGLNEAYTMIDTLPGLEGFFIYSGENGELLTRATPGFEQLLPKEK